MCYKQRAVKSTAKFQVASSRVATEASSLLTPPPLVSAPAQVVAAEEVTQPLAAGDDISRYCPVCSQRLISRRCKLICTVCGYYMSCADYY
jgi:hypothetical protein